MKPNIIPCLRVQHDWNLSFKDFTPIWISYEHQGRSIIIFKKKMIKFMKN
jgi:hypothetical protein